MFKSKGVETSFWMSPTSLKIIKEKMKKSYIAPEATVNHALGDLLLEQLPVSGTGVDHGEARDRDDEYDEEEEELLEAIAAQEASPLW